MIGENTLHSSGGQKVFAVAADADRELQLAQQLQAIDTNQP